jgi:hypothetical protein
MLAECLQSACTPAAELRDEITRTEGELVRKGAELAACIAGSTPLGAILRLRSEELALSSYLRGLNFRAKTAERAG